MNALNVDIYNADDIFGTGPEPTNAVLSYLSALNFRDDDNVCVAYGGKGWNNLFTSFGILKTEAAIVKMTARNAGGENVYISMAPFVAGISERTKENVAGVRHVFADIDANGLEILAKINADVTAKIIPQPAVCTESSPNKFQVIWHVNGDFDVAKQEALNRAIQQRYNTDPSTVDTARVLRVAGLKNHKYPGKPEARTIQIGDLKAHSLGAFKIEPAKTAIKTSSSVTGNKIPHGQHDKTLHSIAGKLRHDGLEEESIYNALVEVVEKRCENYGSDYLEMCRKHAHNICKKPVGKDDTVYIGGRPAGEAPSESEGEVVPWGDPAPFEPLLSPVPPFKIEYLPESFRPWATDVAERMSIPLDYVGICMLCAFSAVIGRRAFVQPKERDTSWTEALNLLGAVVAPSGGMKTPTWKIFASEVTAIEIDWKRHHAAAMKVYDQEVAKYLAANKGRKRANYEGLEPVEPTPRRRLVINDATPESAHTLMEKHPEGLLLYRDEIGGWLSDLDKPGRESAREMFLVAANGNDVHTQDRIGRGEVSAVMCLSFFGGMQPKIAQDLVNDERNAADGTIARLGLISYPNKTPITTPLDRPVNETAREYFRRALRVLAPMHEKDIYLKFSPAAQLMFNTWLETQVQREHALTGPICSHFSKYKGLLPRLAAIFHLADAASAMAVKRDVVKDDEIVASSDISVAGFQTIAPEHLERAITFLGNYLEPHMRRLYGCVKSPTERSEAAFAEHVCTGDLIDGFTARDVKRKHWIGLKEIGEIQYALETFCEMGWIRPMPRLAGAGRPTDKYEINPAVIKER